MTPQGPFCTVPSSHRTPVSRSYGHEEDPRRILWRSSPENSLLSHFPTLNLKEAGPSCIHAVIAEEKQQVADQGWVQRCRNETQHLPSASVSPKSSSISQARRQLHRSLATGHSQLAGFPRPPPEAERQHLLCPSIHCNPALLRRSHSSDLHKKMRCGGCQEKPLTQPDPCIAIPAIEETGTSPQEMFFPGDQGNAFDKPCL